MSMAEVFSEVMHRAIQNGTPENIRAFHDACAKDREEETKRGGGKLLINEQVYAVINSIINSRGVMVTPGNLLGSAELVKSGLLTCEAGDGGELYLEPVVTDPAPTSY